MDSLRETYRINEENVALRREGIGLTARDIATLRTLAPWARRHAAWFAQKNQEHAFAFAPMRAFVERVAAVTGQSLEELRAEAVERQAATASSVPITS
jgi:cytidylate kinase